MIFNKETAEKTAELLLQINAIKLNPKNPFSWASGWKSPIYCDNRLILSFPAIRNFIRDEFSKNIEQEFGRPDVIAGVATGAIGIGILVAEKMGRGAVLTPAEALWLPNLLLLPLAVWMVHLAASDRTWNFQKRGSTAPVQ